MPGKFVFRLETVLRLRRHKLEEKQIVVAKRLQAIAQERANIEAAREQCSIGVGQSRDVQRSGRLDVPTIRAYRHHMVFLHQYVHECERRIRDHEEKLKSERGEMIKAQVACKAIEKLKERRKERHDKEVNRLEMAEQGEFSLQMHRRQALQNKMPVLTEGA